MPNKTTTERTHDDALPDVLMRVVSELYDVAHLIERIEPQLTSANGQALLEATDRMKVLQGIDLAVQKTRGLAEFIDTFTSTIAEDCSVDISTALSLVKLADMQKALGAIHPRFGHSQPLSRASGEFEAF